MSGYGRIALDNNGNEMFRKNGVGTLGINQESKITIIIKFPSELVQNFYNFETLFKSSINIAFTVAVLIKLF